MKCENCGEEILDVARFCPYCGATTAPVKSPAKNKNMLTALIISFILAGLGIAYAGDRMKALIIFITAVIFAVLGRAVSIFSVIALIIWAAALYLTYKEVRIANGVANPSFFEDFRGFTTGKKIASVLLIVIVLFVLANGIMAAFTPSYEYHNSAGDYVVDEYTYNSPATSPSDSSSDGEEVSSHYEDEYGSADTYGTVYDDGSAESHQTGHTDYGDYEIDSYMDSDGNIHGTVEMEGENFTI